jgi:pimeloyl-ACP methyl ester carboxylesterase
MDFAIAIIDGTGDFDDGDYAFNMAGGFCVQLKHKLANVAQYERGPSFDGVRVRERGDRAARFLEQAKARGVQRLFVAGYSRGGSAALFCAANLHLKRIAVDGMFLFDPVARHFTQGGEDLPANVKYCAVALRSNDPALIAKYDPPASKLAKAILPFARPILPLPAALALSDDNVTKAADLILTNPMRPSFGNVSLLFSPPTNLVQEYFKCSHGAVGGVGWKKVKEDEDGQKQVARWMSERLKEQNIPVTLASYGCFAE